MAATIFRSSRTSGPTMTRAPALCAASNAVSTPSSPCANTRDPRRRCRRRPPRQGIPRAPPPPRARRPATSSGSTSAMSIARPRRGVSSAASLAGGVCAAENAAAPASATGDEPTAKARAAKGAVIGARKRRHEAGSARGTPETDARFRAKAGTLYVVATPLGNLRDVTLRALDVLRNRRRHRGRGHARRRRRCLRVTGSRRACSRCTRTTRRSAADGDLRAARRRGESVALVSDAGTPAISDPGARLVRAVREAGYRGGSGPGALGGDCRGVGGGACAPSRSCSRDFRPRRPRRAGRWLASLAALPFALVLYEAPHRVRATVDDLVDAMGPARTLVVARELTKTFETIARVPLGEAPAWFAADANRERGEFVLLVDAAPATRRRTIRCRRTSKRGSSRCWPSCRRRARRAWSPK